MNRKTLPWIQLYTEDFGTPPSPLKAVERLFREDDVETARAEGFAAGRQASLDDANASANAATTEAAGLLRLRLDEARFDTEASEDVMARALSGLMLASLRAVLPSLCTKYGEAEIAAAARLVLPAVKRHPALAILFHPGMKAALVPVLNELDPELLAKITLKPTERMLPGDIEIAWEDGRAIRDAAACWDRMLEALAEYGVVPDIGPNQTQ